MLACFYLGLLGPMLFAALLVFAGSGSMSRGEAVAVAVGGAIMFSGLAMPFWLTFYFLSRRYGRKFNEVAYLHGLPEVKVKSREQVRWERESRRVERDWKRAMRSPAGSGTGFVILVLIALAALAASKGGKDKTPKPATNDTPVVLPASNALQQPTNVSNTSND
jgi:hypothetical protein